MTTRSFLFFLPTFFLLNAATAQDAEVTFYSKGSFSTSGLPGTKHGIFTGAIFDGKERITYLQQGRFLTLHITPGSHVFSASYSGKHPAENSQLRLDLVEGKKYFIRAQAESRGIVVVDVPKGRLDQVTCQAAHQEANEAHPVDQKHISSTAKAKMIVTASIPGCD